MCDSGIVTGDNAACNAAESTHCAEQGAVYCYAQTNCAAGTTSTGPIVAYNVNWDGSQTSCECIGGLWMSSTSSCCGDDTGEGRGTCIDKFANDGLCGATTEACCTSANNCLDQTGTCKAPNSCHDFNSLKSYCDAGTWHDPDESQAYCEAAGCGYVWISEGSKCCGDDGIDDDDCYRDIGLKTYDGISKVRIAIEAIMASPLRISKSGVTYGVALVNPTDPYASAIKIQTSSGVQALKKYMSSPKINCGGTCSNCVFSMYQRRNSHIATCETSTDCKLCWDIPDCNLECSTISSGKVAVTSLYQAENSHAKTFDGGNDPNIYCQFTGASCGSSITDCALTLGSCNSGYTCLASYFNTENSHAGKCGYYDYSLCCKVE